MSVAAVLLVKDEADVIEHVLRHLLGQVDEVVVADNGSTDGTRQIIQRLQMNDANSGREQRLFARDDEEVGYYQSRKTTELAMLTLDRGHSWVVPCDADEVWYAEGRRLGDFLDGVPPDVQIVTADLYNHLPSAEDDPEEENPFRRIGWRQRQRAPLPKVACRLRPDLVIGAGNHSARTSGTALAAPGLLIRHFSWRSSSQYLRKIRNGEAAYAATDLPADTGAHWRMFAGQPDEAILDHYRTWFHSDRPREDTSLIFDPAPI